MAASGPGAFSYEGRLYDLSGSPSAQSVTFTLSIYDKNGTCLLRSEQFSTIDLSQTDGYFSLTVGKGTLTGSDPGRTMTEVFANGAAINGVSCVYSSAAGDARKLRVTVSDGVNTTDLSPDVEIGSTPFAMVADTIQGKAPVDFLQVPGGSSQLTQTNLESIFATTAKVAEMQALASGSSTKYAKATATTGIEVPSSATTPTTPAVGQMWYEAGAGTMKFWNGTVAQTLGVGGSGITSLTAGAGIVNSPATITTTGTVAVDVGTTANKIVQLDALAKLPAVDGSQLTGLSAGNLTGVVQVFQGGTGTATGSIVGSGALSFTAGGTNENVTMAPSGTGAVVLNGKVGIGTTTPTSKLDLQDSFGSTASELYGGYSKMTSSYTGATYEQPTVSGFKGEVSVPTTGNYNATTQFIGVKGVYNKPGVSTSYARGYGIFGDAANPVGGGNGGTLYGVYGVSENNSGAGVVESMYGVGAQVSGGGTANVEVAGILVDMGFANMTVPNAYGVKIKALGGGSNRFGIYQMGINDRNFFAGNVGIGTTTPQTSLDLSGRSDAIRLPAGTDGQRPASPMNGDLRYNSTINSFEGFMNGGWVPIGPKQHIVITTTGVFITPPNTSPTTVYKFIVIGGGGGGGASAGANGGGGGGAGAIQIAHLAGLAPGTNLSVTIGVPGSGGTVGGNGGTGTTTTITGAGYNLSASPGMGGNAGTGTPGAGGAGGTGTNVQGGVANSTMGANGQTGSASNGGNGGNGMGLAGQGGVSNGPGGLGSGFGSGGGGGAPSSADGGNGAAGAVIIEWQ
jgi:hypothetical protein